MGDGGPASAYRRPTAAIIGEPLLRGEAKLPALNDGGTAPVEVGMHRSWFRRDDGVHRTDSILQLC